MSTYSTSYRYFQGSGFQAIQLPFGANSPWSMDIYLPAQSSSLATFEQQLTTQNWNAWQKQFQTTEPATLQLPRCTVNFDQSLIPAPKALGMRSAFAPSTANFSAMTSTPAVYISAVEHKTYLKVDEAGTTAAAVTSVTSGIGAGCANPCTPLPSMIVNRPFFLTVHGNQTGTLLFVGAINNPLAG
jgi:serine protease inhibitor